MSFILLKYQQILASLRFLLRRRLSISSESIETKVRSYHFSISEEKSEQFNQVVAGKNNGIHPLYLTKISWHVIKNLNDFLDNKLDPRLLKMLVHLSDHFEVFSALELDKKYEVKSSLCLIAPHKKGTRLTVKFDYFSDDQLVVTEHTTGLLYGVKCIDGKRQFGELPKIKRENERVVWTRNIPITYRLPYQYAEKAEIDAPIHTNPTFAKSIGLPDIILQGTCTFAIAVSLILDEYLPTDIRINTTSVNFTGMLLVANEISVRVLYKSESKVVFDVLNKELKAVIKGGVIEFSEVKL